MLLRKCRKPVGWGKPTGLADSAADTRSAYSYGMQGRTGVLHPSPPLTGIDDDGRSGWVWLVTTKDVFEAELLRGLLESSGVPVALDAFDRSPFAWMYPAGNMQRPVQVLVPAALLEAARLHLLEFSLMEPGQMEDRIEDQMQGQINGAGAVDDSSGRTQTRLLRDRLRPAWFVVAILTSITVGWLIVVEVLGFAPCEARILCLESDGAGHCSRVDAAPKEHAPCTPNP